MSIFSNISHRYSEHIAAINETGDDLTYQDLGEFSARVSSLLEKRTLVCCLCENTIAAMENLGATRRGIRATVGPCIAQSSYQVDVDFSDPFIKDDPGAVALFRPDGEMGKQLFDLQAYVLRRLEQAGIGSLGALNMDTYVDEKLFFSFRRACHRGEDDYGRGLSAITLTEAPSPCHT